VDRFQNALILKKPVSAVETGIKGPIVKPVSYCKVGQSLQHNNHYTDYSSTLR
jgi:hypothetical protein